MCVECESDDSGGRWNPESWRVDAVCAACGDKVDMGDATMVDVLTRLVDLQWGIIAGMLVCPLCLVRAKNWTERMDNAHLN